MKATGFFLPILFSSFLLAGCNNSSDVLAPGSVPRWFESSDSGPFLSLVSEGNNLIGSGPNGVFLSTDGGLTWSAADSGLPNSGAYHVAVEGNTIIAGNTLTYGAFISTNDGATWSKNDSGLVTVPNVAAPGNYQAVASLAGYGPTIFAGIWYNGAYRTADPANIWTAANNGMSGATVFSYAFIGSYIFAGTNAGIFLSTDNGTHWTPANNGLTINNREPGKIPHFESLATNGRDIYAGAAGGELFVSKDYGKNWTDISTRLQADAASGVYIGVKDSCLIAGTDKGVFATMDDGATWTDITDNIPNPAVSALFVIHHFIFVSSGDVVWRTPL